MPRSLYRVACVALIGLIAACQSSVPASPDGSRTAGPASQRPTPAPSSETPSPSGAALKPISEPISNAGFDALIATPDGFVAAGSSSELTAAVIARGSADGRSWQRLAAEEVFGVPLAGLAQGPLGWVAAEQVEATGGAGVGAVLSYSSDGQLWQRLPDQADLGHSLPGPISAGAWGFAMRGQAIDSSGTSFPAVWVSRDGQTWGLMPPTIDFPEQVVVLDDRLVVLGMGSAAFTIDGSAWVDAGSVPGGDEADVGVSAGLGATVFSTFAAPGPMLWRGTFTGTGSQASLEWESAGLPNQDGSLGLTGLATGRLGALVLGFDRSTLRPISWVARDGRAWQRADLEGSAFGGGVPSVTAVGDESFVALGWNVSEEGDAAARAWTSIDGLAWSRTETDALGVLPDPPTVPCPGSDPTDAAELVAMTDAHPSMPRAVWPSCFGDRELTLDAYVALCDGCGGVSPYEGVPAWLLDPLGYADFWLAGQAGSMGLDPTFIAVKIDPDHPVDEPRAGAHVRVTGHFDDPASATCRLIPFERVELPPAGVSVATCRQQFVVTRLTVLPD